MLYHIVNATDDEFARHIDDITKLYWPKEKYENTKNINYFKEDLSGYTDEDKIKEVKKTIAKLCNSVGKSKLYRLHKNGKAVELNFPFAERFHEYFFLRQWEEPDNHPHDNAYEYLHLHPKVLRKDPSDRRICVRGNRRGAGCPIRGVQSGAGF